MEKTPDTNLMILKRSRTRPKRGDLFVCNVMGKRWLAGRVIRTDVALGVTTDDFKLCGTPSDILVYIYDMEVTSPEAIQTPIEPKLLIPPQVTTEMAWKHGVFMKVRETELQPEEVLAQHCFRDITLRGEERFLDEDHKLLAQRYEPCGSAGVTGDGLIAIRISEALGIPWKLPPDDPESECGRNEVILYLPDEGNNEDNAANKSFELDEIEDQLSTAIESAGLGTWEGHGYHMVHKRWDVRFNGQSSEKIAETLLPILKDLRLPQGSFLVVGGKTPRRIDLTQ